MRSNCDENANHESFINLIFSFRTLNGSSGNFGSDSLESNQIMEKVKKNNIFPPLVIPDAYKRKKVNSDLSKEGQRVKVELERRQIFHQLLRQRMSNDVQQGRTNKQETEMEKNVGEFCAACSQRVSLQAGRRPSSKSIGRNSAASRGTLRQCICILCNKALTPTPHGLRNQILRNDESSKLRLDKAKSEGIDKTEVSKSLANQYESGKDFQISSLNYDARLVTLQQRAEIEHYMPPKEVMRRSERKCQLWLMKNEEHFRSWTS